MVFSEKTLDFLIENRVRDDRNWYQENKKTFQEYVLAPLQDLVEKLAPVMLGIDSQFICQPKIGRAISRIHRDTRFSKDKSIFRDHMWCTFRRNKNEYGRHLPEIFFEISPRGFSCGCGYYKTDSEALEAMRKMILNEDEVFKKAFCAVKKQDIFHIYGEMYKRSKYPDAKEDYKAWLDRKSICLFHESQDFELLFSDGLADWLAEKLKTLAPVYKFFLKAESYRIKDIR